MTQHTYKFGNTCTMCGRYGSMFIIGQLASICPPCAKGFALRAAEQWELPKETKQCSFCMKNTNDGSRLGDLYMCGDELALCKDFVHRST